MLVCGCTCQNAKLLKTTCNGSHMLFTCSVEVHVLEKVRPIETTR